MYGHHLHKESYPDNNILLLHLSFHNPGKAQQYPTYKYYIQGLNYELIKMMIENTLEKVDYFVVDWKGTNSADKQHLVPLLEEFNIPVKKTKDF